MIIDGKCWGWGSQEVGNYNHFDLARCAKCNRRVKSPLWYEGEPQCLKCALARHAGCPCGGT